MTVSPGTDARPLESERLLSAPLLERRARSIAAPRNRVGWLVLGGRALLIWLPVYVLLAPSLPPLQAVLATSIVTAIWTIGLRAALSTYFTLGPAVASAAGTIMGLVAISALDLWVSASSSGRCAWRRRRSRSSPSRRPGSMSCAASPSAGCSSSARGAAPRRCSPS